MNLSGFHLCLHTNTATIHRHHKLNVVGTKFQPKTLMGSLETRIDL